MLSKTTRAYKNVFFFLFIFCLPYHINAMDSNFLTNTTKSSFGWVYSYISTFFSTEDNLSIEELNPIEEKEEENISPAPVVKTTVKKKLVISLEEARQFINKLDEKESSLKLFDQWVQACKKLPYNRSSYLNDYTNCPKEFDYEKLAISAAAHLLVLKDSSNLNKPKSWIGESSLNDNFFTEKNNIFMPFVQKLVVVPGAEIAYHGDLHGDIHSLITYLEDLQNKDYLEGFTIKKEGFYMIFLGDYVDRGNYGSEIIYTLLNLKIANPNKVYLIRGNHEDRGMNFNGGFSDELNQKFPDYIYSHVYNLYNTLPAALFIGSGSEEGLSFLQCCHGGMEIGFFPHNEFFKNPTIEFEKINSLDRVSNMEALLQENSLSNYYKDNKMALVVLKHILKDKQEQLTTLDLGFLWSDFILPRKIPLNHKGPLLNFNQGRGFEYSKELTKKILKVISQRISPHKLVGVFRAHQHDYNINGMMGLILDKGGIDPENKGVAKLWRKQNCKDGKMKNLWPGIVCTFNVSPDSSYGFNKYAGFNFESYGLLKTGEKFPDDWHLGMQQIEMDFSSQKLEN